MNACFDFANDRDTVRNKILWSDETEIDLNLRLGRRFVFQQDNDTKQISKATQQWLMDIFCKGPQVAQPELGLELDQTSLERPENGCPLTAVLVLIQFHTA